MPETERFLRACRRESVDCTPVWFMRQAGRYMPEYREIRRRYTLLEICKQPELAVQVTLQPVDRLAVDAAILFSDLLIPLAPMGIRFDFVAGEGPQIENPIASSGDVERLRSFEPREELTFTLDAIRELRRRLKVPLIGFAGAPFTLASYAIEGGASRQFEKTKSLMYREPRTWHRLGEHLANVVADYLTAQVEAGAQAIQLFDSWVGALSPDDYREFALPHTRSVFTRIASLGVPTIHFGTGTTGLLPLLREAGGEVIGLDWRVPLDVGWAVVGNDRAVQGNLDPILLFSPEEVLFRKTDVILDCVKGRQGHIFNLGHGILPKTPVERVASLVEHVHRVTARPVKPDAGSGH